MIDDDRIALERVQSESFGALASIQSYREVNADYFDRFRLAVTDAVSYFQVEDHVPQALLDELAGAANILRNEATAFPGRLVACNEMADWLDQQRTSLSKY